MKSRKAKQSKESSEKYLFILRLREKKVSAGETSGISVALSVFCRMLLIIFCSKLRVLLWREGVYNEAQHSSLYPDEEIFFLCILQVSLASYGSHLSCH